MKLASALAAATIAFASPQAFAQAIPVNTASDPAPGSAAHLPTKGSETDRAALARYMYRHPSLKEQVDKDPKLIYDKDFLLKNKEFSDFLDAHPSLRGASKGPNSPGTSLTSAREHRRAERIERHKRRHPRPRHPVSHSSVTTTGGTSAGGNP